jgi:hypothetical protein
MRRVELLRWIEQLEDTFGPARPAVDSAPLLERYREKNYTGMLSLIAKSMNLDARLRIGYVTSGGLDAPLWVRCPEPMPYYGSPEFKNYQFTIFIRKETIRDFSFDILVAGMAHELSHVLLNSLGHVARGDEEAVDLTAMLFGYGKYFLTETRQYIYHSGYLSEAEIKFARAALGA